MTEIVLPILITFAIAAAIGPALIPLLKKLKFGQVVRDDGPQSHLSKSGTPTMGGFIFIIAALAGIFIFTGEMDSATWLFVAGFAGFGLVGFIDDFIKVVLKRSKGLSAKHKALLLLIPSVVIGYFVFKTVGTEIKLPFTDKTWDIGWWIIPLSAFVLLSSTNSANLADGLDGQMAGINLVYFAAYALIVGVAMSGSDSHLMIICLVMVGAMLGFIVHNTYPARVFMGDTGSLALGGAMGMMALLTKTAIWLPFMGIMIVLSSVSVIIQVGYYKKTKKRFFKMAPLHHHFEQLGYPEMKISAMYIIITAVMSLIGVLAIR